jgi:hypothetical protein
VHHGVVGQDSHHTSANSHSSAQLLVANKTMSLISDCNVPVTPSLAISFAVANVKAGRDGNLFRFAQPSNNSRFID